MRNPHEPDPLKGAAALATAMADTVSPPDTIRLALIRVDFLADRAGSETTGDGHFDLSKPDSTTPPIDRAPHDSAFYAAHLEALKRYYTAQSYGRVVIEGDVWPRNGNGAYSVSDMADFGPREALGLVQALRASTVGVAATVKDPLGGRLVPGAPADLIVLPGLPTMEDLRAARFEDVRPRLVLLGGAVAFER